MAEAAEQLRRRLAEQRRAYRGASTARIIGANALNSYEQAAEENELLIGLPAKKRPAFLDSFTKHMGEVGFPLESLTPADRPHVATAAHRFILDMIAANNKKRASQEQDLLRISPISQTIPTKLKAYYAMFNSSLTDHESEIMHHRREEVLAQNVATAQTYLPLKQADISMVNGFAYMMEDFYPGPGALAARELLAAYGADRARVAVVGRAQNQ